MSAAEDLPEDLPAETAPKRKVYFRRSPDQRLPPDQARRQGEITHLAFQLLGREAAIAYLNAHDPALGARPLDLATGDLTGFATVESAMRLRAPSPPDPGR